MQSNKENEARGIALYNSDTDDWTLVSPPVSSSGSSRSSSSPETSPERNPRGALQQLPPLTTLSTILTEAKQSNTKAQSSFDNANQSSCSRREVPKEKKQASHRASSGSGSKVALDGANMSERANDADDESDGLTEVNLDENGIAIIREQPNASVESDKDTTDEDDWTDDDGQEIEELQPRRTNVPNFWTRLFNDITLDQRTSMNDASRLEPFVLFALIVCSCSICYIISLFAPENASSRSPTHQKPRLLINNTFDLLYSDPSNHAYTELKMLNEEIADCIERENPVMRELAHWRSMNPKELSEYKMITNTRPFKGLVCYENEVKWRKRFNYLKTEFNFDLRKIIRQVKRKLTNDILVSHHPQTPFELVLNQLEYLDHVEQRRKDRAIEKLKAENLELLRRLNKRSEQGERDTKSNYNKHKQQEEKNGNSRDHPTIKSLIILESENIRLRREMESLKSRLAEKAGTVYVKQSIELEKCERENSALKQFHQDVADEISKNLLKVGLHKPETFTFMTTSNKDEDSISAKLASTKHFFMKLGDEITNLLEKSKDLEKDLTESKMLNALVAREAQNLIKEANETKQHLRDNISSNRDAHVYQNVAHLIRYPAQQYRQPYIMVPDGDHNIRGVPYEEKSSLPNPGDFDKDWLSKRAQLREQLRESSKALERHLSDLRHFPRSTSSSSQSSLDRSPTINTKTHYDSQFNRYNDIEHKRLDSLKKLNRPTKFSSSSANYYNQNSHKNCKNHHKRDEL